MGDCYSSGDRGIAESDRDNRYRSRSYRLPPPPGIKNKDLIGVPWETALALRADGWYPRADVVWDKPNAVPETACDRPMRSHEYAFLLSVGEHYHYASSRPPGERGSD